jgi:IPT/TIG domain
MTVSTRGSAGDGAGVRNAARKPASRWVGSRRLGGVFALALAAFFIAVASASAGEPPTLTKLTISPNAVNTTSSSQTVKVTADITSTPGFAGGSVQFESPTEADHTERVSLSKVTGTSKGGTWDAMVPFKRYIAPGTWRISTLNLNDSEGNAEKLSSTQLQAKGFEHTVSVTSTEDNEAPQIVGLVLNPSTVNTTGSSQTVTITAHITDNLSGMQSGFIVFRSPSGRHATEVASFSKVSGEETDGMWEAKVTFKHYTEPGAWKVAQLHMQDDVENGVTLGPRRLASKGLAETVQVESVEDEEPPALAGLSISPSSVNVTSSSQTVAVTAHVTDNLSGFNHGFVTFESPNGKQVTGEASFTKVSGSETNGSYEAIVTFEQFIQSGTWKVRALRLVDNVGNATELTAAQISGKGLPSTVGVTSTEDTAAPALATFSISPSTVNTMTTQQTVAVTAEITDNASGFAHGSIVFESPNGKVVTKTASFNQVSGTATKGIYEAQVTFRQYVQSGTWKVSNVNLTDKVGNEANISASGLAVKTFPNSVNVESTEDTEPPVLKGLTISPRTINTVSKEEFVVLDAHVSDNLAGFSTGFVAFENETGKKQTGSFPFSVKVSGTETDGTFEAVVTFRQSSESGTWKISSLSLLDHAGNEATVTGTGLEAKGLPATVFDETSAPPTVRKVAPKKGPAAGGTVVTITGTNFAEVAAVKFGGKEAIGFTVESLTRISATSPAGTTGKVDVTVTTANGTSMASSKDRFAYENPTVTGLSPNHGSRAGGTEVTITGTGFATGAATSFTFGKGHATSVNCTSKTTCTVMSPASARASTVNVVAAVAGKKSAKTGADLYTYT